MGKPATGGRSFAKKVTFTTNLWMRTKVDSAYGVSAAANVPNAPAISATSIADYADDKD